MAVLFVKERLVDLYIVAIDSTLLKAKGHLWHKSSMIKGVVPRSGIDTDARWGFSHTAAGIITAIIGVLTFIKAMREYQEYQLQGEQKRLDLFLNMRRKFNENETFCKITALIDEDSKKLTDIPFTDKRDYAWFFQEVALMANSGLIKKPVAQYMFGYFAVRCCDSEVFWAEGINKDTIYLKVFNNFALETKKAENSGYKEIEKNFRL
ncbi:MAG TPA: hypothetical protein VFI70_03685 [Nitrososphaeraceae archaeon]|nr:hypothetical protein [Nitrososphaeraceae archaeon]